MLFWHFQQFSTIFGHLGNGHWPLAIGYWTLAPVNKRWPASLVYGIVYDSLTNIYISFCICLFKLIVIT